MSFQGTGAGCFEALRGIFGGKPDQSQTGIIGLLGVCFFGKDQFSDRPAGSTDAFGLFEEVGRGITFLRGIMGVVGRHVGTVCGVAIGGIVAGVEGDALFLKVDFDMVPGIDQGYLLANVEVGHAIKVLVAAQLDVVIALDFVGGRKFEFEGATGQWSE